MIGQSYVRTLGGVAIDHGETCVCINNWCIPYCFFNLQFTFASNTATILGGTLVGQSIQLRVIAIFVYSFLMTVRSACKYCGLCWYIFIIYYEGFHPPFSCSFLLVCGVFSSQFDVVTLCLLQWYLHYHYWEYFQVSWRPLEWILLHRLCWFWDGAFVRYVRM